MLKRFLADNVLHPAGVPFRYFRVYTDLNQSVGKEAMLFVDLFCYFSAYIGQVQEIIAVHRQKAPVP